MVSNVIVESARRCYMTVQDATVLPDARSVVSRPRSRCAKIEHRVQHVDRESDFGDLRCAVSASGSAADELLVEAETPRGRRRATVLVATASL